MHLYLNSAIQLTHSFSQPSWWRFLLVGWTDYPRSFLRWTASPPGMMTDCYAHWEPGHMYTLSYTLVSRSAVSRLFRGYHHRYIQGGSTPWYISSLRFSCQELQTTPLRIYRGDRYNHSDNLQKVKGHFIILPASIPKCHNSEGSSCTNHQQVTHKKCCTMDTSVIFGSHWNIPLKRSSYCWK